MKLMRKIGFVIGIVLLIWCVVSAIVVKGFGLGNVTGIVVATLLLLYMKYMQLVHIKIRELWEGSKTRVLVGITGAIITIILVLVVVETGCMISACMKQPVENATVVVLGCKVNGDRPSLSLEERLVEAYEYLSENPKATCIVTGGKGDDENISEAECMYRWLVEKGIEGSRIYKEERATSTKENIVYAKEIILEYNLNKDIVIVTSDYHTYRAGITAEEIGLTYGSSPSRTSLGIFPSFYIRELYAIIAAWTLGI